MTSWWKFSLESYTPKIIFILGHKWKGWMKFWKHIFQGWNLEINISKVPFILVVHVLDFYASHLTEKKHLTVVNWLENFTVFLRGNSSLNWKYKATKKSSWSKRFLVTFKAHWSLQTWFVFIKSSNPKKEMIHSVIRQMFILRLSRGYNMFPGIALVPGAKFLVFWRHFWRCFSGDQRQKSLLIELAYTKDIWKTKGWSPWYFFGVFARGFNGKGSWKFTPKSRFANF